MAEIKTIIQLRNDTAEKWATEAGQATPLKPGEVAVEIVDGKAKLKIGTAEDSTFGNSEYFGSDVKEAQVYQSEPLSSTAEQDDIVVIEGLIPDGTKLQNGDIAIVKRYIAGNSGAISYTSYVYDSSFADETSGNPGWAATDGNYSASNVFLKNKIELAGSFTSVGNYNKGKTINAGTSLESLLSGMLQQELYPTANDKPNAEITASGGSGEVGSEYTVPTATLKITDVGSYEYGDKATGITFAVGSVKLAEGSDPDSATNYKTNDAVMSKNSTITLKATGDKVLYTDAGKSYTFSGTASYEAGKVPVTNLGNEYASAQIPAGDVTIADKTVTFSGYRKAFAGGSTVATLDSAAIRAATATKNSFSAMDAESEALEFTAAAGATKVFFAYPSTWSVGSKKPYFEMFGLAWGENTDIVAKDDVQVADYRGTVDGALQGAIAYKLYCWELDTPLQAESTKFRVWFK